jgi:hypothetical protein
MTNEANLTWKELVEHALQELGGEAHLKQINEVIAGSAKTLTNPTWRDTIRRVVRQYSVFQPVPPSRSGIYRLVSLPDVQARPEQMTGEEKIDHSIAQGMLLTLGRMYGYDTFAPINDQTARRFLGQPLSNLASIRDCTNFCDKSLPRVRQIDAIWLGADNEGPYPIYAFEVEHTTGVRSGIDRLVEIPDRFKAQLFVVAPGQEEQNLFEKLSQQNRFRRFRDRLQFRRYADLSNLYNAAVNHNEIRDSFGVRPRFE